jgi:hypothetical protein
MKRAAPWKRRPPIPKAADPRALEACARFQAPTARPATDPLPSHQTKQPKPLSAGEEALAVHLRASGLPGWVRQYRLAAEQVGFGPGLRDRLKAAGLRDFRFDFAFPRWKVAIEIDGFGRHGQAGRHQQPQGYADGAEKRNQATVLGWQVLVFTSRQVKDGSAIKTIILLVGDNA